MVEDIDNLDFSSMSGANEIKKFADEFDRLNRDVLAGLTKQEAYRNMALCNPNPEVKSCFNLGIEIAKKENCDLVIGTDPDADRMGIVLKRAKYFIIFHNKQFSNQLF